MNKLETQCAAILFDMVENEGLVGVKTSFEDEGATFEEVIRLKEICNNGKTKLFLKIGGPEAVRDLKDSMIIGVKGIVAPMVESAFALKKFIQAANTYLPPDVLSSTQLAFNAETIGAVNNIKEILSIPEAKQLYSVTVGRVDLTSSQGWDRTKVNGEEIHKQAEKVFTEAKYRGLKTCLGGAVSVDSEKLLIDLHSKGLLDKFETRYAIFDPSVTLRNLSRALDKAQEFELLYLQNKQNKYHNQSMQDAARIKMIESRKDGKK